MASTNSVPLLAVNQLSVIYPGHQGEVKAVDGVSFTLAAGEILAVIGESGAGKSAIAQAIPGLLPGNARLAGQILYQNRDLLNLDRRSLAALRGREIAMIFQDPSASLDPVFSIGRQMDEAIALYEPQLSAAQRRSRAVELLTLTGIPQAEKRLRSYPHQFSGGQIQRIMIAVALAGRPKILIADEPTTALDVTTQQEILDLLFRLNQQYQMAVLLITHDMGVVADIAHRVLVMRHGRVVEQKAVEPLFSAPAHAYTQQLLAAVPSATGEHHAATSPPEPLLQVEHLHISYASTLGRRHPVVNDVSFAIGKGEFLGLLGESGSGKTTIGRSLLGMIKPDGGTICLAGEPLYDAKHRTTKASRAKIGAIFQNPASSLNPKMSISQSIAEPLITHTSLDRAALDKRVSTLIDLVGLPAAWRDRYPYELSGGQCQRIAIARAIALRPQLLIADEPTSALDVSIQQSILALLRNLQQEYQFGCLFISHDLAVVRSLCRSIVVLKNGQVAERGSVERIFTRPESDYTRTLIDSIPLADPRYQQDKRRLRAECQEPPVTALQVGFV
ncbi:ABC transporter ATP-binding protein [Erwinia sp. INIA-01]|uniref:dipeptide ABC transporter ATP-binding protein n=1 Tax=Erwinia sp. INIA01 TaxID=2991500 RepID=UPI002225B0AC|nr:ABC transporter ATP-binding protein [Erwinia sp. INIA01]MCW1873717.1 ABC transporter ATP-binding protein [Erwinia sp. INIA01]